MADPDAPNLTNFGASLCITELGYDEVGNESGDDDYDGRYPTDSNKPESNKTSLTKEKTVSGRCSTIAEESESVQTEDRNESTLFVITCPDRSDDDTVSRLPDYDHLYPEDRSSNYVHSLNNIPEQTTDDRIESDCDVEQKDEFLDDETMFSRSLTLLRSEDSRSLFTTLGEDETAVRLDVNMTISDSLDHSKRTQSTQGTTGSRSGVAMSCSRSQMLHTNSELPRLYEKDSKITQSQRTMLLQEGFPIGLLEQLEHSRCIFPVRYWVVDNSGSMRTMDGHQIRTVDKSIKTRLKNTTAIVKCSRWDELQTTISDHAELAGLLHLPTIFRFLNDPDNVGGRQEYSVAYSTVHNGLDYNFDDVREINRIVQEIKPKGATPLTCHLVEFGRRIEALRQVLQEQNRAAVVVVVTDGIPTDDDGNPSTLAQHAFLESIRSLNALGASVVIRLCTADEDVVSYFHNLDKDVDIRIDVLSDFLSESRQVNHHNSWLNYALPLHRCRELGLHHRLFDILDERLLTKDELLEFLKLLFGMKQFQNAPDIHTQWTKFKVHLKGVVEDEKKHWYPITNNMEYWINMSSLEKLYSSSRQYRWTAGKQNTPTERKHYMKNLEVIQQKGRRSFPNLWKRKQAGSPLLVIDERMDVQQLKK